ncbi:SixA phosphatase family protein [Negadavirga shengliensis]|uniref:SixA phosphatase family protein n=1 Tax=Negadavirga shengliensis TaxID=1389218 RepID=A0ABV9SUY8_9BACT
MYTFHSMVFVFVLLTFWACSPGPDKNIYIIRHAEKMAEGNDPELTEEGKARAERLSRILEKENITAIYSTDTKRTKATVMPLASKKGITIDLYDVHDHDALIARIRKQEGDAVVVGHSNTIHHVANYFVGTGKKLEEIEDPDYENIFVARTKSKKVDRKRYDDFR